MIYGTVGEDKTKQNGEGFDVKSPDTGTYVITFLEPFVNPPSLVATLKNWGADNQIIVKDITPNKAQIAIWNLGLKQQSGANSPKLAVTKEKPAFNFLVIGEGS